MTKDYNRVMRRIDDRVALDEFFTKALIAFLAFVCMALMFAILTVANGLPTAEEFSVVGATTDNLMSPERAEFMVLFEHGQEFDEGDMQ